MIMTSLFTDMAGNTLNSQWYKEGWVPKNWCFQIVVLEKTLESPLDCKEIRPVHPKGNQSWIFIGRIDADAETAILWPPDAKNWLIWKDPDAGKDWRQKEKGTTEDEMVGWHHWLNGHESEQTLGDGEGQRSLAGYSPRGHKELDTIERLTHFHVHCHSTISSSVIPFSSCPQSFPASQSFQGGSYLHQVAKASILQLHHQSF